MNWRPWPGFAWPFGCLAARLQHWWRNRVQVEESSRRLVNRAVQAGERVEQVAKRTDAGPSKKEQDAILKTLENAVKALEGKPPPECK